MTLFRALPLLALLAAACAPGEELPLDEARRAAVEDEVRAAALALVDALNAHDADSILAFYQLDDAFTQVACTEVRVGGRGFANLTRALHTQFRDAVYDLEVRSIRVLGADAAVVSLQGTMLAPLVVTRTLQRGGDGRWLVVHEHESWPDCPPPAAPHPGTAPGEGEEVG